MTTNVFDQSKKILASDSRWSFRLIDDKIRCTLAVAYVDDTGFDKIAFDSDTAYMFAGPGDLIDLWRTWSVSEDKLLLNRPPVRPDFAICMTDRETGEIIVEHGQKISGSDSRFAGTGAKPAYECWNVNRDPSRAVTSATQADFLSGGTVKYLDSKGNHNIDFGVPFSSINQQFLKKGMVMYIATNQAPVPINQAAQNDPRIKELVDRVKGNDLSAEAPSGFDPVIWTPADEKRLDDAISARLARKAKLK